MKNRPNPRQLVLRRDTATGLIQVGWDPDLPVGRFEHLELICELMENVLPDTGSEYYDAYQTALQHAREENRFMLEQQAQLNQSKGWYLVPFKLARDQQGMVADSVGNYVAAAMQLLYQLTRNRKQVWAVIQQGMVVHVRPRYPQQDLDELTYQVWYHKQLDQLNKVGRLVMQGKLIICESGLWFEGGE